MLRLWKIAPNWQSGRAKISTWLYQVVANLCKDRGRKPPMTALEEVPEPIDPRLAVDARLQDERRASALYKALDQLPHGRLKPFVCGIWMSCQTQRLPQ